MNAKEKISDYSETEFLELLNEIMKENIAETDEDLDLLLEHFEKITEHPEGTDLIYYAQSDADSTPEEITKKIKEWRTANGLPGFKEI